MRRRLGDEARAALDRVDARAARVRGIEPLRLAVKASFLHSWGWEARGTAFASGVSDEQACAFDRMCPRRA